MVELAGSDIVCGTRPVRPVKQEGCRNDHVQRDDRDDHERRDLAADAPQIEKAGPLHGLRLHDGPAGRLPATAASHLDLGREHVAAGAHRLDHRGLLRIGFDLAPDAADQHIDAAFERAGAAALGQIEQAVARQHAAGPLAEHPQQIELGAGHRDPGAVGIAQFAQAEIDPPAEKAERGRPFGGAGGQRHRVTAQHRVDPRQQFTRIEGLRKIIVGAHLEAEDAIDILAARGQHDDRDLQFGAELAAQAEAVFPGQHDVENDQVDAMIGQGARHFAAIGGGGHVAGVAAQIFGDQRPRLAVVLDDKDVWR